MDEAIKNEVKEVTTDLTEVEEVTVSESSGPSKGFVALVTGGLIAAAVGVVVAVKRRKRKKVDAMTNEETGLSEDDFPEDVIEVEAEKFTEADSTKHGIFSRKKE